MHSADRGIGVIRSHLVLAFFTLTLTLSWGLYSILPVPGGLGIVQGNSPAAAIISVVKQFSPTISGLVVTALAGGWRGVRTLVRNALRWRAGIRWYVLVIIGVPTVTVSASAVYGLLSDQPIWQGALWDETGGSLLSSLLIGMLFAGASEELFGWRGFALPALLNRMGPLPASAIIGIVWNPWHVPLWAWHAQGISLTHLPLAIVFTIALSLIMTFVYLRSSSILLAGFALHAMYNAHTAFANGPAWMGQWVAIVLGAVAAIAFILRPRSSPCGARADETASALQD